MKKLLSFFLILFLAIGLGFLIQESSGYVMIVFQRWVITTNFWVAVLSVFLAFIIFYALIRFFKNVTTLPQRIEKYSQRHRSQKKQLLFLEAVSEVIAGNYKQAEKKSLRAISVTTPSTLYYLTAALAAHCQGNLELRNKYLARAYHKAGDDRLVVALAKSALLLKSHEYTSVIHELEPLLDRHDKNHPLLSMLSEAYQKTNRWAQWLTLLPLLNKNDIAIKDELGTLELTAYEQLLKQSLLQKNPQEFERYWEMAPKNLKQTVPLLTYYLRYCHAFQQPDVGQHFIEATLKKRWEPSLLFFYLDKRTQDQGILLNQLQTAEHWLKKQGDHAALLAVLANLSLQTHFLAKATAYADKALNLQPCHDTLVLLASVFAQLGNKDKAIICYRRACGSAVS